MIAVYIKLPEYVGKYLQAIYPTKEGIICIPPDYYNGVGAANVPNRYRIERIHEMIHDTLIWNLTSSAVSPERYSLCYSQAAWSGITSGTLFANDRISTSEYFGFALPAEYYNRYAHTYTETKPVVTLHSEWISIFRDWTSTMFWQQLKMYVLMTTATKYHPSTRSAQRAFLQAHGISTEWLDTINKHYTRSRIASDRMAQHLMDDDMKHFPHKEIPKKMR